MSCMCMTRANAAESSDDRAAGEVEITEGVEQLMANELVGITQAASVQYMIAIDHDDVIERSAATEPRCSQTVHFVEKAKCTRAADLRFERRCIELHAYVLLAYQRVGEIDFEAHRKAVIRQQRRCCTVLGDGYRFEHLYRAPRHFRTVQFDDRVVHLCTGQCGHQVLNRTDRNPFPV